MRSRWPWQGLAVAGALAIAALVVMPSETRPPISPVVPKSAAADDYTSFFAGSDLAWSGWTTCDTPIRWSADVRALSLVSARRELRRMSTAIAMWGAAVGVSALFTGRERLSYDTNSNSIVPADGSVPRSRHVYLSVLREGVSPLMRGNVIGLAMPSRVIVDTKVIVTGVAMFRAKFVHDVDGFNGPLLMGLYLHELGHVFGLGHARLPINAMYSTVREHTTLGPGDVHGVQRARRPCGLGSGTTAAITNLSQDALDVTTASLSQWTSDRP